MTGNSAAIDAPEAAERLLRSVWAESLPAIAFDPNKRWRDVGIDSLRALEFVLRLERALGRKITFDGMEPDSTAGALLRRMTVDLGQSPHASDGRAPIFFIPALGGDDQAQAEFRRVFRREAAFEVVSLEASDTPSNVLGDIRARADHIAKRIDLRQPEGGIRLAGYSHGGVVAQETARKLEAAGRVVTLLLVLDGLLTPPVWIMPARPGQEPRSTPRRLERLKDWMARIVGPVLQRLRIFELARLVLSSRALRRRAWSRMQTWRLLRAWGHVSLAAWRPAPVDAPTLFLASDDFGAVSAIEVWRRICPRLRVVNAPGDHYHFLRASNAVNYEAPVLEALAASTSR